MSLKDLNSNVYVMPAGADGVSLYGYNAVVIAFSGATGVPGLQESLDGTTGWTAVDPSDITGDTSEMDGAGVRQIGYKGMKAHIRPTVGGATGGFTAIAVLGHPTHAPAGQPGADHIRIA